MGHIYKDAREGRVRAFFFLDPKLNSFLLKPPFLITTHFGGKMTCYQAQPIKTVPARFLSQRETWDNMF